VPAEFYVSLEEGRSRERCSGGVLIAAERGIFSREKKFTVRVLFPAEQNMKMPEQKLL
jgi:hypothetical protein